MLGGGSPPRGEPRRPAPRGSRPARRCPGGSAIGRRSRLPQTARRASCPRPARRSHVAAEQAVEERAFAGVWQPGQRDVRQVRRPELGVTRVIAPALCGWRRSRRGVPLGVMNCTSSSSAKSIPASTRASRSASSSDNCATRVASECRAARAASRAAVRHCRPVISPRTPSTWRRVEPRVQKRPRREFPRQRPPGTACNQCVAHMPQQRQAARHVQFNHILPGVAMR